MLTTPNALSTLLDLTNRLAGLDHLFGGMPEHFIHDQRKELWGKRAAARKAMIETLQQDPFAYLDHPAVQGELAALATRHGVNYQAGDPAYWVLRKLPVSLHGFIFSVDSEYNDETYEPVDRLSIQVRLDGNDIGSLRCGMEPKTVYRYALNELNEKEFQRYVEAHADEILEGLKENPLEASILLTAAGSKAEVLMKHLSPELAALIHVAAFLATLDH